MNPKSDYETCQHDKVVYIAQVQFSKNILYVYEQ